MARPTASARWSGVLAALLALAGFGLVMHASFPGYLNADTVVQLTQILTGKLGDWHSPFIALVWSALLQLFPGPVGFIVFDNLLIWGALALLAAGLARATGGWGLAVLAVPLLPGAFNFLGHVHKDAMLVAWLLAAFACAFRSHDPAAGRGRTGWLVLANLFALAAFLTRSNAIFAIVPLLLYANLRLGWWRSVWVSAALLVLMPVVQTVQNRALVTDSQHPGDSIKTFHLLALSYFEGRNLFPGEWSEEASRAIVDSCYSPVQWDVAASWGQCAFIYHGLRSQGLWGSPAMTRAWLGALAANPLAAYSAMAATFRRSMHDPNSRNMLYPPPKSELVPWEVAPPLRATTAAAQDYARSEFNDRYGRPWLFAVVLALGAVVVFALRLAATRLGLFALAVIASGTIYLLTYFPLNVSAEFRYFYWSAFAAYLGLAASLLAWRARRRAAAEAAAPLPGWLRLGVCAAVAAMLALVFSPFKLPLEKRGIVLTPLGDGAVTVTQLSTMSIPLWMGVRIEGWIEAPDWRREGAALRAEGSAPPLIARIENLHHMIRLRLRTGPDGGRVRVEEGAFVRVVDTRAAEAGEYVLDLLPQGALATGTRHASWLAPARAGLWFVVLTALLLWLSRPGRETQLKRAARVSMVRPISG